MVEKYGIGYEWQWTDVGGWKRLDGWN